MSSRVKVISGRRLLQIDGISKYVHGTNYPSRHYGEFGSSIWGEANRVSNHKEEITRDFEAMSKQGVTCVRWFLFTDGRNGIEFDARTGLPTGLAGGVFEDMEAAIGIAKNHGMRIIFSVLDFKAQYDHILENENTSEEKAIADLHPKMLGTEAGHEAFRNNVLIPVLDHFKYEDTIFAWEIINEPDWILTETMNASDKRKISQPLSLADFVKFICSAAEAVHQHTDALVTLGGARVNNLNKWGDDALGLDFLQVHLWYDAADRNHDRDLVGGDGNRPVPAGELGFNKPVLIGEVPGKGDKHQVPVPLAAYVEFAWLGAYAGALVWAYNDSDYAYDGDIMLKFAKAHPTIANPKGRL